MASSIGHRESTAEPNRSSGSGHISDAKGRPSKWVCQLAPGICVASQVAPSGVRGSSEISCRHTTSGSSRSSQATISWRRSGQPGSSREPALSWATRSTSVMRAHRTGAGGHDVAGVREAAPMRPELARSIWHRVEAINAVTYFCPECREAPTEAGLEGFWMGYFACRAAPMGAVRPGVVEATFANFHPSRVRRAIPAAWDLVEPDVLVGIRADAAAAALRRLLGDQRVEELAADVRPMLGEVVERAVGAGRPLFAANRDLDEPADPVAALWQAATTVREHRGDGHVALLAGAGLDGCESHVLFAACEGVGPELYLQSRGWSEQDWQAAVERLAGRGLLASDGSATDAGRTLRQEIEQRTDEMAALPFAALDDEQIERLVGALTPAAEQIAASGEVMFPNPMGLPRTGAG